MHIALAFLLYLICILVAGAVQSSVMISSTLTLLQDAEATLKTGDLIFTKSENLFSHVQQYFFGSAINHCCMIVKFNGTLWVWDCNPKIGAYITTLSDFIATNWEGKPPNPSMHKDVGVDVSYNVPKSESKFRYSLYIRRFHGHLDQDKVISFIRANVGRPYSYRFWVAAYCRTVGVLADIPLPWHYLKNTDGSVFCSELLALTYQTCGVLKTPAVSVLPVHFWENSVTWNNAGLMRPERLFGEKLVSRPLQVRELK